MKHLPILIGLAALAFLATRKRSAPAVATVGAGTAGDNIPEAMRLAQLPVLAAINASAATAYAFEFHSAGFDKGQGSQVA